MKRKMKLGMKRMRKEEEVSEDNKPSFYCIMLPISRISQELQIPSDFVEHINGSAFKKANLRDPSGRSWPVKLHVNETGIFIKDGWVRFFEDHCIRVLDFLTFTYDGETCFDVSIFDRVGIEKVIQMQDDGSNVSNSFEYRSGDEIKSDKGKFCDVSPGGESLSTKRGRPRKDFPPNYQPPFPPHGEGQDVPRCGLREGKQLEGMKSMEKEIKTEKIELSDEELASGYKSNEDAKVYQRNEKKKVRVKSSGSRSDTKKRKRSKSQKRPLLSERGGKGKANLSDDMEYLKKPKEKKWPNMEIKDEINELSDELEEPVLHPKKSKNSESYKTEVKGPSFEKYIDLDNFQRKYLLKLPRNFADKYLLNKYKAMTLTNEKGKSWEVNFVPSGVPRFCGGWVSFMRDNKLKLGDHCIFELVRENEMKVYISRL